MKELYREGQHVLGIFDKRNYIVATIKVAKEGKHAGEEVQSDEHYFNDIRNAMHFMVRAEAKRKCTDLHDLIRLYDDGWAKFSKICLIDDPKAALDTIKEA